jgi:hypothetical protein
MTNGQSLLNLLSDTWARDSGQTGRYAVTSLPDPTQGWIGCGGEARAVFLLHTAPQYPLPFGLRLPTVIVSHGVQVLIDDGSQQKRANVTVVECTATERPMIDLFVRCVGSLLIDRTGPLSGDAVVDAIERLLELFRTVNHATDAEILGLWSELVLIAHSRNPTAMLNCWRLEASSRYDFGDSLERLDVKATIRRVRQHELSFDQANPPQGAIGAIASMMTECVSTGVSVGELWDKVLQLVPSMQHKIDKNCVSTLGRDWQVARERSFDLQRALGSLRVYPSYGVPRISTLPPGVLSARFVSDFGRATEWKELPPSPDGPISLAIECSSRHLSAEGAPFQR